MKTKKENKMNAEQKEGLKMDQNMKFHKSEVIITSIITLCPILIGLLLWDKLPDTVATHFDSQNTANGWSSKGFAVIGIPCFCFFAHLLCMMGIIVDPKNRNITRKLVIPLLWCVPVCSIFASSMIYLNAMDKNVDIGFAINILCGILFIVIGNYMPKCRQNYTVGIKTPWTLDNEENWNMTHRLAGWCFLAGGVGFIINSILFMRGFGIILILLCAVLPIGYSLGYYLVNHRK